MSAPSQRPLDLRSPAVRSRLPSALVATALAVVLGGCGGGSTKTTTVTAAGAAARPAALSDAAYAQAVDTLCRRTSTSIRGYLYAVQASTDAGDPDAADAISIPAVKQYIFNAGADLRVLAAVTPPARWNAFGAQVREKVQTSAAAIAGTRKLLEGGVKLDEIEREQKLVTAVPFDNRTVPKDLMAMAPRCRPDAAEQSYDPGP